MTRVYELLRPIKAVVLIGWDLSGVEITGSVLA